MSEITPNTPNPVREDAYVEELSEKLGIDPQYIPKSPVWRNEEEIKAIAEMFANMSGGGSSGGGALVVNRTWHEDNSVTLDKTWKEISDAGFSVLKDTDIRYNVSHFTTISSIGYAAGEYSVAYGNRYYVATSADGYPSESTGGGAE